MSQPLPSRADLLPHWSITVSMLVCLLAYNLICQVWAEQIQQVQAEELRVLLRSIFYGVAIVLFPLTKLIRHILLRLNQTMPAPGSARRRYLLTIAVTLGLIEVVGLFGLVMFVLGDGFNTLYIFSGLAGLGIFLHKPDLGEYLTIAEALAVMEKAQPDGRSSG